MSALFVLSLLRIYLHTTETREGPRLSINGQEKVAPKDSLRPRAEEKPKAQAKKEESEASETGSETEKAKTKQGPRRIKGDIRKKTRGSESAREGEPRKIQILIFFSSLTASTEKITQTFAQELSTYLRGSAEEESTSTFLPPRVLDLSEVDYDEYFITPPKSEDGQTDLFYLFLIPSYNIDTINDNFLEHLKETHHDFRIDTSPLAPILGYSVFGFGDREGWPTEEEGFCVQAKDVDKWMAKLSGRKRAYPLGMGDWKRDGKERLSEWRTGLVDVLNQLEKTGSLGEGVRGSGDPIESDDEEEAEDDGEVLIEESAVSKTSNGRGSGSLEDVEDIGRIMELSRADGSSPKPAAPLAIDFTTEGKTASKKSAVVTIKEMVPKSSPTYAALTKQGYSIVGSHSGVKICRWTKSALRGRGSCYKFSFYGINSHQCMESTPSLSCSNKCVFCWRHGTTPVGTTWRWVVDPPQLIFDGVKENHYKKIKMMRGVPGVRAERFAEAMRIRHLSLIHI